MRQTTKLVNNILSKLNNSNISNEDKMTVVQTVHSIVVRELVNPEKINDFLAHSDNVLRDIVSDYNQETS